MVTGWGRFQKAFHHPFPLSFPPIHDRYGSPSQKGLSIQVPQPMPPTPIPLPLFPGIPRGPPTSEFIQSSCPPRERCLLRHSTASSLPPRLAVTFASLGFHSDATKGRGRGGARGAEAPFDWWVAKPLLSTDSPPSCPRSAPSVGLAS